MKIDLTQGILSRLYTDSVFRNDFIKDKELFYKKYSVSSDETIKFIEALPVDQIVFFAQSLLSKRIHEVKALLPLSHKLIGKNSRNLFLVYAESYIPKGIHKHHDDAQHFADYLLKQEQLSEDKNINHFIHWVLKYELHRTNNFINPKKYLFYSYPYDFVNHYSALLKTDNIKVLPKKRIVSFWINGKILKF